MAFLNNRQRNDLKIHHARNSIIPKINQIEEILESMLGDAEDLKILESVCSLKSKIEILKNHILEKRVR